MALRVDQRVASSAALMEDASTLGSDESFRAGSGFRSRTWRRYRAEDDVERAAGAEGASPQPIPPRRRPCLQRLQRDNAFGGCSTGGIGWTGRRELKVAPALTWRGCRSEATGGHAVPVRAAAGNAPEMARAGLPCTASGRRRRGRRQRKRSRATRSSSMVWKRLLLSTAIARITSSDNSGANAGFTSMARRALPCTCWCMTDT